MSIEMTRAGISFKRQAPMPSLKSRASNGAPIHIAQMLTYLRVADLRTGLMLNFNSQTMRAGLRRGLR